MASELTHLSLFSGIGGIDLAAEWAGFESVAMVERDKYCQKILAKNFPNTKIHDDVTTFNATEYRGKIDLLSGGFPCQPHSLAGQRKASADERDLWDEVVRIIRDSQPRWFLGENVRGLLSSESGKFFGRILNDLESLGYRVGWCLYGAKDIGAVHRRERVFIVAYSDGIGRNLRECNFRERSVQTDGFRQNHQEIYGKWDERNGRASADHVNVRDASYSTGKQCNGDKSRFGKFTQPSTSEPRGGDFKTDAADTESIRWNNGSDYRREGCICAGSDGVIYKNSKNRGERGSQPTCDTHVKYENIWGGDWRTWDVEPVIYEAETESRVCRANDGIPNRVDRLRALGNAVVPQQVYPILAEIANALRDEKS